MSDETKRLIALWENYLPAYDYSAVAKDTVDELAEMAAERDRLGDVIFQQNIEAGDLSARAEKAEAERDEARAALKEKK